MNTPPPPDPRLDARPVVAIFRSPLFNASETFVQAHAAGLRRYRALLVGLEDYGNAVDALRGRLLLPEGAGERLALRLGRPGTMAERLRAHAPRLVHAHFGPDALVALGLARRLGVALVTTLHGYDVSRSQSALLRSCRLSWMRYALGKRSLMAGGDLFLAVSEALRRRAVAAGYPVARTLTHYNGVDLASFRAGGDSEPDLVLHVGRLVEKKGTALLLRAFAQVKAERPNARLAIIGDGPLRRSLERLAAELGLGASVSFLGALRHEATAEWMRRAWLLAAPSLTAGDGDSEGLPQVAIEAAASSLPVVASDHSGLPEAIEDGLSGYLVPEGKAEPLARRIVELLGSAELRASMAHHARSLAEQRFDSVRQIERLERLYDGLIGAPDR